jgi:hypothetical protein
MTNVLPQHTSAAGAIGEHEPRAVATTRVLIVVDELCTAPDLCASVRAYADNRPLEALVIAPAHESAATQWYVDEEAARADATHRLRGCLACLGRDGIRVHGQLGDRDPVYAIADALHHFAADEIVLITSPQRPSRWLHQNVIDRTRHTFQQQIKHIVMPPPSPDRSEP